MLYDWKVDEAYLVKQLTANWKIIRFLNYKMNDFSRKSNEINELIEDDNE